MAKRGRPRKHEAEMLNPITIRFTRPMMEQIEKIMAARIDGADKGQVIRELVAKGLEVIGKETSKRK